MILKQKKQKHNDIVQNIISNYFKDSDLDFYMNPTNEFNVDMEYLNGIDVFNRAHKLLKDAIDKNKRITILVDQDADGFTSSAVLFNYLEYDIKYTNTRYILPKTKSHGLNDDIMEELIYEHETELLIVPDAGSNDIKYHNELNDKGIDLIVLDHHLVNDENVPLLNIYPNIVTINNQLLTMNKHYTGVGMVYVFCKFFDWKEKLSNDIDKYLDLLSIGQTGDVSDISDKELRYYTTRGLENINNKFIKAVMKEKEINNPSTRDLSFSIISMINSVTRIGTHEEKALLFYAMVIHEDEMVEVEVKKKNKKTGKFDKSTVLMTIHEQACKELIKIKTRQDNMVRTMMKKVDYIYNGDVVIGLLPDKCISSITGLVAMKISSAEGKPVMIGKTYQKDGDFYYSGSSRAPSGWKFKEFLTNSGYFDFVNGHENAHGWKFKAKNLKDIMEYLDSHKIETTEREYLVEKIYEKPNPEDIFDIVRQSHVFGGQVSYPLLGYDNMKINVKCINTRGSITTFFDNEVSFVLYNSPVDILEQIEYNKDKDNIYLRLVGEPSVNTWNGTSSAQIVVSDFEFITDNVAFQDDVTFIYDFDF